MTITPRSELIIGGARSGKSRLAEQRAQTSGLDVCYIATAEVRDGEMQERIRQHQLRRPAHWQCIEEPLALPDTLHRLAREDRCLLVDCLTLWLSNLIFAGQAARQAEAGETPHCPLLDTQRNALLQTLPTLPGRIILVSNEVGWGIVPMHPVSRLFADLQGRLNQQVGAVCEAVTLVAAGLPLTLKGPTCPASPPPA